MKKTTMYLQKKGGCMWLLGKLFIGGLVFLLALGVIGFIYETVSSRSDVKRYPPPGKLVDVGEYKIHLNCTGQFNAEQPTIILDAAGGLASADWALVQPSVAEFARVCSYDRAGYGWSDSGSIPRTSQQIATELHTLLLNAGEKGPYLLVGHSFGGHTVRLFADQYANDVAGMILIDTRPEDMLDIPVLKGLGDGSGSNKFVILSLLSHLGVTRLLDTALVPPNFQEHLPDYPAIISYQAKYFDANRNEALVIAQSDEQVKRMGSLNNMPLAVIRHGVPDLFASLSPQESEQAESVWQESQERIARSSTIGQTIVAEESGHFIPIEQPEIVIDTIQEILQTLK